MRRPVLAIVANLLIVVAGLAAFGGIEIRELPNIDQPVVTITTTYVHVDPRTWTKKAIAPHMRAAVEAGARGKITDHAAYFERTDRIAPLRA